MQPFAPEQSMYSILKIKPTESRVPSQNEGNFFTSNKRTSYGRLGLYRVENLAHILRTAPVGVSAPPALPALPALSLSK